MKRLLIAALLCSAASLGFAQTTTTETTTTTVNGTDTTVKKTSVKIENAKTKHHSSKPSGFNFGVTFSRFDLGLTTLIDNGSFTLSPQNDFLSYRSWKSSNVGFDLIQFGYRFTPGFKVNLSAGFDWTLIRLRKDITIQRDAPVLTYTDDAIHYSKNRFSSSYLRIPLSFELRSKEYSDGKRARLILSPEAGILLGGRVKQISAEKGKQKFDNDYHFAKIRYGLVTRIGYGDAGFFAKYYFNDMFENSPAQKGLKNFAVGLTFGF